MFALDGRTALITGASGGIGSAIANARLILSDKSDDCVAHARALTKRGAPADGLRADLSKPEDVKRLAARALEIAPKLDILVCNAGVGGPAGPLSEGRATRLTGC